MGKSKHKKHHRHDIDEEEGSSQDGGTSSVAMSGGEGGSSSLKLILKVGGSSSTEITKSHSEKHKKKKKKKDRKKEKEHKHRHHHKDKTRNAMTEAATDLLLSSDPVKAELLSASTFVKEEFLPMEVEPQLELEPQPTPVEFIKSPTLILSPPRQLPPPQAQVIQIKVEEPPVPVVPTIIPILNPVLVADSVSGRSLTKLLEHFINHLQRKDTNQIFANPVDDNFAPGYSEIIKQPMDFSTMRIKLNSGKYPTLLSFLQDFELVSALNIFLIFCLLCE